MEDENYQKELFEFDKPKKSFPKLSGMLPKADLEGKVAVTLTLERIIFISIGIILLMVILYAMGVEKGKAAASASLLRKLPAATKPVPTPEKGSYIAPPAGAVSSRPPEKITVSRVSHAPVRDNSRPYTIMAATFKSRDNATQTLSRLKREGFDAFLIEGDPYLRVCVGSYSSKEAAQKVLNRVKLTYKDACIRLK